MPVSREQFDADLAASIAATNDYIAAVDAFIGLQQVIDLAAEDEQVNTALAAVNAAKDRIPHQSGPKA